jgi:uncharacterized membrane protein HdeD (DUF308 family)
MMALPILELVDIFSGGGAMLMVGLWLGVSGVIVAALFRSRARAHDDIVAGPHHMVRWQYPREQWLAHANADHAIELSSKWALWRLIAVISIIIGGSFAIVDRDAGLIVFAVLLGLLALLAAVVSLTTSASYRHARQHQSEVVIGRDGAIYNGVLHVWRGWGARLGAIRYPGPAGSLTINYTTPSRYTRTRHQVRIPVPPGREPEAAAVARMLAEVRRIG